MVPYALFDGDAHFVCFVLKIPFLGKFGQEIQNCSFNLKSGTQTNWNMLHSMVMFTFPFLGWRDPALANFDQQFKIAYLS